MSRRQLDIANTWDGRPLADEAVAHVVLVLSGDALRISVDAPLGGDPAPAAPVGSTPRLWEHEVVEVFIAGPGDRYTEIELGPWGHHLVLKLEGVRNTVETVTDLPYRVQRAGGRWRGEATLDAAHLPAGPHRVNGYAIGGLGDARRYCAAFPATGAAPDFHRLETFRPWADLKA